MSDEDRARASVHCAFCDKRRRDVAQLIEREDGSVAICDECIVECVRLLAQQRPPAVAPDQALFRHDHAASGCPARCRRCGHRCEMHLHGVAGPLCCQKPACPCSSWTDP